MRSIGELSRIVLADIRDRLSRSRETRPERLAVGRREVVVRIPEPAERMDDRRMMTTEELRYPDDGPRLE